MKSIVVSQLAKNAINPNVVDWVNRVVKNGGVVPSYTSVRALNNFYNTITGSSYISKLKSVVCFVPDNLTAAFTPLIKTSGFDPWTNTGPFVDGDLTIDGIKGNASTKYLKTGCIPVTCFASTRSCGLTLYITSGSEELKKDFGCTGAIAYEPAVILYPSSASTCIWDGYYGNASGRISGANTLYTGYISGNRTANDATAVYTAKSTVVHTTLVSGTSTLVGAIKPTIQIYFMAGNRNSVLSAPSSKRHSFAAVHEGLTIGESSLFFDAVHQMRKEIGGGYV